jgi:hypothetical protein
MCTHSGGVLAEFEGKKFVTGTPDCQWDENILWETIIHGTDSLHVVDSTCKAESEPNQTTKQSVAKLIETPFRALVAGGKPRWTETWWISDYTARQ